MGADVIKVEARNRPDPWRGPMSPEMAAVAPHGYPGADPGPKPFNRSTLFHGVNRNKRGITLDLASTEGVAIFRELVKVSDVVAENFTPRVMTNLGLGYETLRQLKTSIIMLSMPAYGTTGPDRDRRGVGGSVEPMSGMSSLMGYADGPPMNHGAMYPDPVAGMMAASALLIALHHRGRTGVGQSIDLSQQETNILLLGEALMDYSMNGTVRRRQGNRHRFVAPHQNYRCRGEDDWIAISVSSDTEWHQLIRVMGRPTWCREERFATIAGRLDNLDELDRCIETWTTGQNKFDLMHRLQQNGVAAGAVLRTHEVMEDEHLQARGYVEVLDYGKVGSYRTPGLAWRMSATPGRIWRTAPDLGQDSESVLAEILGMNRDEYRDLVDKRVTGEEPIVP
jgi:crotonobetainyl-CoA:carnitine CoA-transferase CaiB-like acyl-CoA transferase